MKYLGKDENGDSIWVPDGKDRQRAGAAPVEGWALGCIGSQLEQNRAHAKLNGFTDVEWVPDKEVKGWFNFRAPNAERQRKYAEKRGMCDKNGQFSGQTITSDELDAAERLIRERYPAPKGRGK